MILSTEEFLSSIFNKNISFDSSSYSEFHEEFVLLVEYKKGVVSKESLEYFFLNKHGIRLKEYDSLLEKYKVHFNHSITKSTDSKLSVIITTYNRTDMLLEAVESIVNQDYKNVEIIIIDDCSLNSSEDKLMKYRQNNDLIYIYNAINRGPGRNRATALNMAKGEYILFLDDDDYLIDNNYITSAIVKHEEMNNLSFVAANVYIKNKDGLKSKFLPVEGFVRSEEYFLNFEKEPYLKPTSTLTAIFKKQILLDSGVGESEMANDSSIYLRALLLGDAYIIKNIVGVYRIHGENISFSLSKGFLIENLWEKKRIKDIALTNFDIKLVEEWYRLNILATVYYYFSNSAKDKNDFNDVHSWVNENCHEISLDVWKIRFRQRVKKVIKKFFN